MTLVLHPVYIDVWDAALAILLKVGQILSHAETWTALATVFIAIFTYTLKRATDRLWDAGRRQLAHAEQTAERQLRAWVGPVTTTCKAFSVGHRIEAKVIIINTGQSPAQNMRVAVKGHILDKGVLPPIPDTSTEPPKTLFPSIPDEHPAFHNMQLSLEDQEGIDKGKRTAWIIVRIDYFIGENDPRYTNICTRWDRSRRVFVPHEAGNDAN